MPEQIRNHARGVSCYPSPGGTRRLVPKSLVFRGRSGGPMAFAARAKFDRTSRSLSRTPNRLLPSHFNDFRRIFVLVLLTLAKAVIVVAPGVAQNSSK